MDTGNMCYYCLNDNGGNSICPHCGKSAYDPVPEGHLIPGEIIGGRFAVGRAVGQDAAGIVYNVYDLRREKKLRIREYFPKGYAMRGEDHVEVVPAPDAEEVYQDGLTRMITKA